MLRLKDLTILDSKAELAQLQRGKLLINTINAHSFNTAKKDYSDCCFMLTCFQHP